MMKETISRKLYHHCSLNNTVEVKKLLETYADEINITEKNGLYFGLAISQDSLEMLKILLDFHTKKILQYPRDSDEFLDAQSDLCEILQEGLDSNDVSSEMQILINKYLFYDVYSDIDDEYDSDNESGEENSNSFNSDLKFHLTEQNLKKLNESQSLKYCINSEEQTTTDLTGQIDDLID